MIEDNLASMVDLARAHKIRVEYFNAAEDGSVELSWKRTGLLASLWPAPRFTPGPLGPGSAALDQARTAGRTRN